MLATKSGIIKSHQRKGDDKLEEKIKKLVKLVAQLNKLGLKVLEFLGTLTLIVLSIKSLIEMI